MEFVCKVVINYTYAVVTYSHVKYNKRDKKVLSDNFDLKQVTENNCQAYNIIYIIKLTLTVTK